MNVIEPPISDEAVKQKTGKDWGEWFAILDTAGAQAMTHKQIVAYLVDKHQVSAWWQQMITVTYEQARGLRQKHEKPSGYQVSRSRTFAAPVGRIYVAWLDPVQRAGWLSDSGFVIRKATPNKTMRITWVDGTTNLDVSFTAKGSEKTQLTVQHDKLPSPEAAEQMKMYWSAALDSLEEYLTV